MVDRDSVIARIQALRARAADAASSEAEAEAAARIAAKIIAEHSVTEAELIERGTAGVNEGTHNDGRAKLHPALNASCYAIGLLTECRALLRRGANIWVGQPEDVEFALYLCELIQGASERAYQLHRQRLFRRAPPALYRRSFLLGFGIGVSDRMRQMVAERQQARSEACTTGTSLAVVKEALIDSYLSETRPTIRERRQRAIKADQMAVLHGQQAARSLVVNRPLGSDEGQDAEMLGRAR